MANIKQEEATEEGASKDTKTEKHSGYAGVHYVFTQDNKKEYSEQNLKKLVLLDSDSKASIICEKDCVTDI